MKAGSTTVEAMRAYLADVMRFMSSSLYAANGSGPNACDFCFGNPQEMPLPEIQRALTRWAVPQHKDWFAYKQSEAPAVRAAVESLRARTGIDFDPRDVSMTTGAFGGLASSLRAVVDPADEVVYLSPPWFFYVPMLLSFGATPVRVDFEAPDFRLPLDAIASAITRRTRAIIINTPHNPSGRVLDTDELRGLADVLRAAPNPVYMVSDESYARIVFDAREHLSPLRFYDLSFLVYTFGKTLLTPGQRLGYVAMSPAMPDRERMRDLLWVAQATNWAFPNALMQYVAPELEPASIDVSALQRRRDRLVSALDEMGYEIVTPEGTFYVLVRSPIPDEVEFVESLGRDDVFVLPGRVFELPGWFRISLTANDAMVERSLAGFQRAIDSVQVTGTK